MKIKATNRTKTYVVTAMALSATILLAGCQADTTKEVQTDPTATGAKISNNRGLEKENNAKEENQNRDIENANNTKEENQNKDIANANDTKEENQNKDIANKNDIKEENQDKDIANKNNVTNNQETPSGKTDIYDYVLAEYSDMVQNDFYTNLRDSDDYESCFGKDIGLEIRTHEQAVYYAFYDVDGNGTDELIIAGGEHSVSTPSFSPWNYDLYGYDGTKAVHIFPEMEFGYRTNFSLYENGVIEVAYSGGAAESGIDFYKLGNDGLTPELIDSFSTVAHLEGDKPVFTYYQYKNEIPEAEYHTQIQSYEVALTTTLDWVEIQ